MSKEVLYGRTPVGHLLYDLAFTNSSAKWLARKHRLPVAEIRKYRATPDIKKLRKQSRLPVRAP